MVESGEQEGELDSQKHDQAEHGVEAATDQKVPDAGSGSIETGGKAEQLVAPLAGADTRCEAEQLVSPLPGADTRCEAEQLIAPLPGADTGGEAEQLVAPLPGADTGGEAEQLAAPLPGADSGGEAEQRVVPLPGDDTEEVGSGAKSNKPPPPTSRLSIGAAEFKPRCSSPAAVSSPQPFVPHAGAGIQTPPPYPPYYPYYPYAGNPTSGGLTGYPSAGSSYHPPPGQQQQRPTMSYYSPPGQQQPDPAMYGYPLQASQEHQRNPAGFGHPTPLATQLSQGEAVSTSPSIKRKPPDLFGRLNPDSTTTSERRRVPGQLEDLSSAAFPPLGGSSPSMQSASPPTSGSSSRVGVSGYSSVTSGTSEAEKKLWGAKLLAFLNHEDSRCYRDQIPTLAVRVSVDFKELFWKDRELGLKLCETQGTADFWLQPAVKKFFKDNGLPSSLTGQLKFKGMPSRLRPARVVLESLPRSVRRSVCGGIAVVDKATLHGRRAMDTILCGILVHIAHGVSWKGGLKLDDLFIEEDQYGGMTLFIGKEPLVRSDAILYDRLADLKSIWTEVGPLYTLPDEKLPLYFDRLRNDLMNATSLSPSFVSYLRHHPSLYSSLPRKNFIIELQQTCKLRNMHSASQHVQYRLIFLTSPLTDEDWRGRASSTPLIRDVLNYLSPAEKKLGETIRTNSPPAPWKGNGRYRDTRVSLLDLNRNGLEHLNQIIKVVDLEEIELYIAHVFPNLLPDLILELLNFDKMVDLVEEAWYYYQLAKWY